MKPTLHAPLKIISLALTWIAAVNFVGCGRPTDPKGTSDRPTGYEQSNKFPLDARAGDRAFDSKTYVRNYSCDISGTSTTCSEQISFGPGNKVTYVNSFSREAQTFAYTVQDKRLVVQDSETPDLVVFDFVVEADRASMIDGNGAVFVLKS